MGVSAPALEGTAEFSKSAGEPGRVSVAKRRWDRRRGQQEEFLLSDLP